MSTIQRYDPYNGADGMTDEPNGDYVLLSDHEAAMKAMLGEVWRIQEECDRTNYHVKAVVDWVSIARKYGIELTAPAPQGT